MSQSGRSRQTLQIPVTTFAGITSLSDLLDYISIPTPPNTTFECSAGDILSPSSSYSNSSENETFTTQLAQLIHQTSIDHVLIHPSSSNTKVSSTNAQSVLVQKVLAKYNTLVDRCANQKGEVHSVLDEQPSTDYRIKQLQQSLEHYWNGHPNLPNGTLDNDIDSDDVISNNLNSSLPNGITLPQKTVASTAKKKNRRGRQRSGCDSISTSDAAPTPRSVNEPFTETYDKADEIVLNGNSTPYPQSVSQPPTPVSQPPNESIQHFKNPTIMLKNCKIEEVSAENQIPKPGKSKGKSNTEVSQLFDYLSSAFTPAGSRRRGERINYSENIDDPAHTGNKKRRKRDEDEFTATTDYTPNKKSRFDNEKLVNKQDQANAVQPIWKKQDKVKKTRTHKLQEKPVTEKEQLNSEQYKRCLHLIENILENTEEYLTTIDTTRSEDQLEQFSCPSELLIPKPSLVEIGVECSKLKQQGIMHLIPGERLVKFLSVLEKNIADGSRLAFYDGDDEKTWVELVADRVLRSVEACYVVTSILTSPNMPKIVYIEDVIERVVQFSRFHLLNSVYPEYDAVYRTSPESNQVTGSADTLASIKQRRQKSPTQRCKVVTTLYNRLGDVIVDLASLIEIEILTDTLVLQMSALSTGPFFVENVSELQLKAMKLVTTIYCRYETHRKLIYEEIFSSLTKLPTSKRSLRTYRITDDESIQMITALVLHLVQSVVILPSNDELTSILDDSEDASDEKPPKLDVDASISNAYTTSLRYAQNFLSAFLYKCTLKSEDDLRPIFENFVQDLLSAVNKPEWPSAEVVLSLLGKLLVHRFTTKSVDVGLRVIALDYLGVVAARLRKDAVASRCSEEIIQSILKELKSLSGERSWDVKEDDENEDETLIQQLQRVSVDYLREMGYIDNSLNYAIYFYVAQWYRDVCLEVESSIKNREIPSECTEIAEKSEQQKKFYLSLINCKPGCGVRTLRKAHQDLSYDDACLITQYLASMRPFMRSFDVYLQQILKVLNEPAIAIRTKAMKCLTAVVEADPAILARNDMQQAVHGRFVDHSTSVREAAVDLVGRFILVKPELTEKYYKMLIERVLDMGVSVRKRVIKILRDVCLEQPEFSKITEICCKMMRRVNDEEGIKKLVIDVFHRLWFTFIKRDPIAVKRRARQIVETVIVSKDYGYEGFESLLNTLLKEDSLASPTLKSLEQIVDSLVEYIVCLEEYQVDDDSESSKVDGQIDVSQQLLGAITALFIISKIKPALLVPHSSSLQPYLGTKVASGSDSHIIFYVASILERTVPLIMNPSEVFLASLEEELMKLIHKHGMMVLQSCVSCLAAIVNKVTHNYKLVKDCFQKFYTCLVKFRDQNEISSSNKPYLLRCLFTVGLFNKHFSFESKPQSNYKQHKLQYHNRKPSISEKVFDVLYHFTHHSDQDIQEKALQGIGFTCIAHPEFMLGSRIQELYRNILHEAIYSTSLKKLILSNIQNYLLEEDERLRLADSEFSKTRPSDSIKEMYDVSSGMGSNVIQVYLDHIFLVFFHQDATVRMFALKLVCLVLRQGLVQPVKCVPYLIVLSSDDANPAIKIKADQQLSEIDTKYPGFIHMKASQGIKFAFNFHSALCANDKSIPRGYTIDANNCPIACISHIYSLIRSNRTNRRALMQSLLSIFDDNVPVSLHYLVFLADCIASLPYQNQDEPLFIIHHIDIKLSIAGANIIQTFKQYFYYDNQMRMLATTGSIPREIMYPNDDDEDENFLLANFPVQYEQSIVDWYRQAQGCILLLTLKNHLKFVYGFSDQKCQKYSPNESVKVYDRPANRKHGAKFDPRSVLDFMKSIAFVCPLDVNVKLFLVRQYLQFKEMMYLLDQDDDDEDDDVVQKKPKAPSILTEISSHTNTNVASADNEEADRELLKNASFMERMHKKSQISKKKKKKRRRKVIYDDSDPESCNDDSASDPDWN